MSSGSFTDSRGPDVPTRFPLDPETHKDLANRSTYHAPVAEQTHRYGDIREAAYQLALKLCSRCPKSRELSTALTKLDEVVFFANAAIARS